MGRELQAPTAPEFVRLSNELAIGAVLPDALKAMAERNGLQEYRFFATALSLQSQTGGGLSETLENLRGRHSQARGCAPEGSRPVR